MDFLLSVGYWALLVIIGMGTGFLYAMASSGSALSLPALVMLGMPETVANATNRIPVLIGSLMATISYSRRGQLDWHAAARLVPAAGLGSVGGALLAGQLTNRETGILITGAVLIAILLLFTKIKKALSVEPAPQPAVTRRAVVLVFAIGFWIGLITIEGGTYLLLVLMLTCGYALPNANALKVLLIAVTMLVALVILSEKLQDVAWLEGGVLGSMLGAHLGVATANHVGAKAWAYRILIGVIVLDFIRLAWHYTAPLRAGILWLLHCTNSNSACRQIRCDRAGASSALTAL